MNHSSSPPCTLTTRTLVTKEALGSEHHPGREFSQLRVGAQELSCSVIAQAQPGRASGLKV